MTIFADSIGVGSNFAGRALALYRQPECDTTKSDAVVHLIEFDRAAAARISDILATVGVATRYCSAAEPLSSYVHDVPGCALFYATCAAIGRPDYFEELGRKAGGLPIVLAADGADARTIVFALKAGAVDFVEPPFHEADVLDAVAAAIRADKRRRKVEAEGADVCRRFGTLTPRERQVMALVTAGRLNKQAAWDLGLSEITVKAHRGAAMRKMAARTITDLVRMADLLASIGGPETDIFRR
jgi:FixJ family two-component response regulator